MNKIIKSKYPNLIFDNKINNIRKNFPLILKHIKKISDNIKYKKEPISPIWFR